jgi:hypothetical protein
MDQASPALAQELDPDLHRTQPASIESIVPRTTAWYRRKGRPSRKTKAEEQQYLTPLEEKALVTHLLRMAALGTPIRLSRRTRTGLRRLPAAIQNLNREGLGQWIGTAMTTTYMIRLRSGMR